MATKTFITLKTVLVFVTIAKHNRVLKEKKEFSVIDYLIS